MGNANPACRFMGNMPFSFVKQSFSAGAAAY
jgi:hypothetical protein